MLNNSRKITTGDWDMWKNILQYNWLYIIDDVLIVTKISIKDIFGGEAPTADALKGVPLPTIGK